jgi:hypothetical protein
VFLRRLPLFLVAVALATARPAEAVDGGSELTLGVGDVNPVRGSRPGFPHDAAYGDVAFYRRLHSWLDVGLEAGFVFGTEFSGPHPSGSAPDVDGDGVPDTLRWDTDLFGFVFSVTPELRCGPTFTLGRLRARPYVVGGGGLYTVFYAPGTFQVTGVTSKGEVLTSSPFSAESRGRAHGGSNTGGGVAMWLANGWGLAAEARYHNLVHRHERDKRYWIPTARLLKRFP